MVKTNRSELKNQVYLNIAKEISKLSKDLNTQIGCVIIAKDGSPVSFGYNGTVPLWDDEAIPHSRDNKELCYYRNGEKITFEDNKYNYISHAENNAIDFANKDKLIDATIYVSAMPCKACALKIAKSKIKTVVVDTQMKTSDTNSTIGLDTNITEFIFTQANIDLIINGTKIELSKTKGS
jgi:dCMP deaminase